ncbi:TIGR04222 domain-containing membrane protein [Planobispora siamensis]|uniref:TIGR04222 domain-containing membrane protein n=1 Tax=Planobispora siamensis TaxID=936338 RepID=A0A8J3WKE6_9ACTN|nr:TIGR04222 domain-containing membrane protein [Planobispora siamensis]GIH91532.1 hypothetical protein Psi01_21620 [Planobispora siamensis]
MGVVLIVIAAALAVMAVTTAVALGVEHRRVRRAAASHPGGPLTPYELAYLSGGPLRTVNTALGLLARGGGVRVSRGGQIGLVAGAPPSPDPIERSVMDALAERGGSCAAGELRRTVAEGQAMEGLRYNLVGRGLLVPDGALTGARKLLSRLLTVSVLAVVFSIGTAVIGLDSGLTVFAFLIGLVTAVVGLIIHATQKTALRSVLTRSGTEALLYARRSHVRGVRPVSGDLAFAVGFPVALYGLSELDDPGLAQELQQRDTTGGYVSGSCGGGSGGDSSYGGGDFGGGGWGGDSGGSSGGDSGGGSSCGGGGGCGGGCGGG